MWCIAKSITLLPAAWRAGRSPTIGRHDDSNPIYSIRVKLSGDWLKSFTFLRNQQFLNIDFYFNTPRERPVIDKNARNNDRKSKKNDIGWKKQWKNHYKTEAIVAKR